MKRLHDLLKQKGQAVVQTITVREDLFDFYRSSTGFIRENIFPGSMLPTPTRFQREAKKAGLKVLDVYPFGQDYAITLEKWLANFDRNIESVRALGYNDTFIRKWRFYLAYCTAMFRANRINVMQVHLQKL
jgi:cyclopropane-fatty-acyl-phospholipid synthase